MALILAIGCGSEAAEPPVAPAQNTAAGPSTTPTDRVAEEASPSPPALCGAAERESAEAALRELRAACADMLDIRALLDDPQAEADATDTEREAFAESEVALCRHDLDEALEAWSVRCEGDAAAEAAIEALDAARLQRCEQL